MFPSSSAVRPESSVGLSRDAVVAAELGDRTGPMAWAPGRCWPTIWPPTGWCRWQAPRTRPADPGGSRRTHPGSSPAGSRRCFDVDRSSGEPGRRRCAPASSRYRFWTGSGYRRDRSRGSRRAAVITALTDCGVRHVVVSPGSRSAPLARAAAAAEQRGDLVLHVRLDERSAGFLALGLAKVSGEPVAVMCTSGTAVVNLTPAWSKPGTRASRWW